MRRNSVQLTALAGLALLGGAVGVNCSKSSNPNNGDVKLAVVLPGGVHIDNVTYSVLNSANTTIAGPGTFGVTDPHATISLDIVVPVTPTGDAGDEVTLTATDSLGNSCTGTSPRFQVVSGTNPAVMMTLTCGTATASTSTGNIGVTATVVEGDHCPNITAGVVAPDETSVGGSVNVASTATDADGETLTYTWAPAANFLAPGSASTKYTCTTAGTQSFTLTVSDNHTPTACTTVATFTIKCDPVNVCGNGITEPGEQCDPPNGTTCDSNCQTINGTGGTTGTGGGAAGAPGTGGIAATGGTTGTGGIAATGGVTGTGGIAATGGVTGTGGIAATGGVTGSGGDQLACVQCEQSGLPTQFCNAISPPGGGTSTSNTGCDGFATATQKADCYAILNCFRGSACRAAIHSATSDYNEINGYPQPFDDPHPCLCGNVTLNACVAQSSGYLGVCAGVITTGATDDGFTVAQALGNSHSTVGVAVNLSLCDIDNSCESQCGTTP